MSHASVFPKHGSGSISVTRMTDSASQEHQRERRKISSILKCQCESTVKSKPGSNKECDKGSEEFEGDDEPKRL